MGTGLLGAAMIAWAQSHINGIPALDYTDIAEGLSWRWHGAAMPLANNRAPLILGGALNQAALKTTKARSPRAETSTLISDPEFGTGFVVTDGERAYSGLPVSPEGIDAPLLVFHDHLPPSATDLTILQSDPRLIQTPHQSDHSDQNALLCFTPGTMIDTVSGPVAIEDLGPGDQVHTRDNGAQEIVWIGHRRMSGARLFAMPTQRPIRIRAGALGPAGPDHDLLVAPDTRVLRQSPAARALWGDAEVLVRAGDLVGQPGIAIDHQQCETYYINLMLDRHEVIRANGVDVESFHPGFAGLSGLPQDDRSVLLELRPDLARDAHRFGAAARRMLSRAEVEILSHADQVRTPRAARH